MRVSLKSFNPGTCRPVLAGKLMYLEECIMAEYSERIAKQADPEKVQSLRKKLSSACQDTERYLALQAVLEPDIQLRADRHLVGAVDIQVLPKLKIM